MIRLRETSSGVNQVDVLLEGQLDESGVGVVAEVLGQYRQRGGLEVRLLLDGLRNVDHRSCASLRGLSRKHPDIRLAAASAFLRDLLAGYGLRVDSVRPSEPGEGSDIG